MGVIKKYLINSVMLFFYVVAVSILLKQYGSYRDAYQVLFAGLEHASIEVQKEDPIENEVVVNFTE